MGQKKVKNYALYAIGEIFLVVLGILIAIWVSNWNENRIQKESATFHLGLLASDLKEDRALLLQNMGIFEANSQSIQRILDAQKKLTPITDDIPSDLVKLQLEYNFNPRRSGLEVLINSGEIGALDVETQDLISSYYLSLDALIERDQITNSYIRSKYEAVIFENYSYVYASGNKFEVISQVYQDDTRPDFTFNEQQFLSDRKLEALIVARVYQNQTRTELYQVALNNLNALLKKITG